MLLVHKGDPHMFSAKLENEFESVQVKVIVNKTSLFMGDEYRQAASLHHGIQLLRHQLSV